ncbi:MAG: cytochrome b/b6 domain-containing protein [Pirellulaceae bacterium]|nr:cytochrome b/b6 domain-containing protein [Planctomycetales bacterium]
MKSHVTSLAGLLVVALAAHGDTSLPSRPPLHPSFALLDDQGHLVQDSGLPLSTIRTCGACHDTRYISSHSGHADAGSSLIGKAGTRPFEIGPGLYGRWDVLRNVRISAPSDTIIDLSTDDWIREFADRHVGGGPATGNRDAHQEAPQHSIEMNCFLCHASNPNNEARILAIRRGEWEWANTATLLGSGIVEKQDGTYGWIPDAFDKNGKLIGMLAQMQDPSSRHCAQCHSVVHQEMDMPLTFSTIAKDDPVQLKGQIISPQRISHSGLNVANKESLSRAFDVHAERMLDCTDCHFASNNPVHQRRDRALLPDHLTHDPRRLDNSAYLYRPSHTFGSGHQATLRSCESCHDTEESHDWLPYGKRHLQKLSCETCHIPRLFGPTAESIDWTVVDTDGNPVIAYRGTEFGESPASHRLNQGYEPVWLMSSDNGRSKQQLAPYNIVTTYYWGYGELHTPIPRRFILASYLDDHVYRRDIVATFDADGDGSVGAKELSLDTSEKQSCIADRLRDAGFSDAHLVADVQAHPIHHGITTGHWAIRDCTACHSSQSRVTQPIRLTKQRLIGAELVVSAGSSTLVRDRITDHDDGSLWYDPSDGSGRLYILGHHSRAWADWLGIGAFAMTAVGVFGHSVLRYRSPKSPATPQYLEPYSVYMYPFYERLWHWLQSGAILLLLLTGIVVHKPDLFAMLPLAMVVRVHNVLAAVLVANAFLSLFYHLTSGEIKQYVPQPRGFFDQAISQALYYVRGIFRGEPHPFEKTPQRKLNPLQQITYLAILNILLPLQIVTGAMMWGTQRWPAWTDWLGGLSLLGTMHALTAWLFATFILLHVYLTTTGATPLAGIKSMMLGWEESGNESGAGDSKAHVQDASVAAATAVTHAAE